MNNEYLNHHCKQFQYEFITFYSILLCNFELIRVHDKFGPYWFSNHSKFLDGEQSIGKIYKGHTLYLVTVDIMKLKQ